MVEVPIREQGKLVGWIARRGIYPFFFLETTRNLRRAMAVGVLVVGVRRARCSW